MPLDPRRTVAELRELQELTGDENGAQRVAWTDTWERAREWLRGKVAETGAEERSTRPAISGSRSRGASDQAVLIGGHIDSVPNGGWLDGALNVVAGVEVLRRLAEEGTPPVTVRLVNWADEEGARFGRSLFGSSAAAGSMADQDELRARKDADGIALPDALREHGVDLDSALDAHSELAGAAAYLELHIEQGPVLESLDLPLGVVLGTFGVERHQVTFRGQAAHAGSTPMDKRRDALAGAARLELEIREIAKRTGEGAVCTMGGVVTKPGIVTSVVETAECLLDQRHLDAAKLAGMLDEAKRASRALRARRGHRGRVAADLEHRADPLRRRADRAGRRVDQGGDERFAPPAERAAARRSGGCTRRRPYGDVVRAVTARPVAHEAGGHEGGAPRARGSSARQARVEDDRASRGRLEEPHQRRAGEDEHHAADAAGADVLRLEADPAEMVDDDGCKRLARDDHGDERRRPEPRRGHDRPRDVERAESAADPDPPGRMTEPGQRGQRLEDERGGAAPG